MSEHGEPAQQPPPERPAEQQEAPPPPPEPRQQTPSQPAASDVDAGSQAHSLNALLKDTGVEKYAVHSRARQSVEGSETSSMAERRIEAELGGPDEMHKAKEDELAAQAHSKNIGHRLYAVGCNLQKKREEKLRLEREKVILEEMQQVTQRPSITGRARAKPGKGNEFPEHAALWEEKAESKRRMLREAKELEELANITGSPTITQKSARIVESMPNGYKDPLTGWDEQFAKFTAKRVQVLPETMFSPSINANAYRPDTGVCTIYDRLYGESISRLQRLYESAVKRRESEMIDPHTGQPLFVPCFSPTKFKATSVEASMNLSRDCHPASDYAVLSEERKRDKSLTVFETLYQDSKERQGRTKVLKDAVTKANTFSPAINSKSRSMTQGEQRPFYKFYTPPSKDDKEGHYSPGARQYMQQQQELQQSTNVQTAESLDEFLRRNERSIAVKETKLAHMRRETADREINPCTFHPAINKKSVEIFENTHLYGTPVLAHPSPGTSTYQPRGPSANVSAQSPAPLPKKELFHGDPSASRHEQTASLQKSAMAPTSPPRATEAPPRPERRSRLHNKLREADVRGAGRVEEA